MTYAKRPDDPRFSDLDKKVDDVAKDVKSIRDMLISEPEASPMGRALIRRSQDNRKATDDLRDDFEEFLDRRFSPMYDWWNQTKGTWRAVQGTALVMAMIGAFFGILAYFGIRPG